ncbi:hypothetical protein [Caloramator sp. Dgby_cultured_2]|uniref:hypothetical protein n=1 Tax=Caloramator sp. Dgby_cultured_2 TaxID=3029174 RepID=UPI00237E85FB|nr:hypothetical protein [Caloramator sp. Dgby_cultured_2]WDU84033.1 hypothetical protein PWK10_06290 [Caloramator sp. Dgby_cultured_2]
MLKSLKEVINDPQIESSEYNDIYIKKIMVNKKEGRIDVHLKTAKMYDDILLNKLKVFFKQKLNIDSDIFFTWIQI